jgi:hypothetical protein
MAELTAKGRKQIEKKNFAIPEKAPGSGSYPIHDRKHGANALARVKQHGDAKTKKRVYSKVCNKYPNLPACKGGYESWASGKTSSASKAGSSSSGGSKSSMFDKRKNMGRG